MSLAQTVKRELKEVGLVTVYFLVCFGIMLFLKKLVLAEYDVEFYALWAVVVGALVAAKVVVILDKTRVGTRFDESHSVGVAAIGALFQHLARNELAHDLAGTGVSAATRERIVENLGSGSDGGLGPQAAEAAHHAFIHALSTGMWLAAGVSLVGVLVALFTIEPLTADRPGAAAAAEATVPG